MNRKLGRIAGHVAVIAVALVAAPVFAQAWPTKPVRIFVTIGPGAAADVLTRIVGEELSKRWGQSIVVENRAGAGGNIAAEAVAKSAPDGYALLMASSSTHGANASVYPSLPFDPIKDFAPIILVAGNPNVLVVPPTLGVNTLAELIALAKSKPGMLTYGSGGTGTSMHISGEVLASSAGVQLTHIPYKSTPLAVNAALASEVSMTFASVPTAISQVRAGKLKALGLTSIKPMTGSDIPTIASLGLAGYDVSAWFGLVAPTGTPEAVIQRVHADTQAVLKIPAIREKLVAQGMDVAGDTTPAEFGAFIRNEIERLGKVVKASGAKGN